MNQLITKADRLFVKVISSKKINKPETKFDEISKQRYATGNMIEACVSNFYGKTQETRADSPYEEKGFIMTYWGKEVLVDGWYTDCTIRIINKKSQVKATNGQIVEIWEKKIELIDYKKSPVFEIDKTKLNIHDIKIPKAPTELVEADEVLDVKSEDEDKMEWFEDDK